MNPWPFQILCGNNPIRLHRRFRSRPWGILSRAVALSLILNPCIAAAPESVIPEASFRSPIIGERLRYRGYWFGIPVGSGWVEVKERIELEGRPVYHIEAQGHTNEVLSALYPIHDMLHSYVDAQTLQPVRFEKYQREGHYRADEVVTFNYTTGMATYRSLLNQSVKEIQIPSDVQDLLSALYWFRAQALHPQAAVPANLYSDEKIYETHIQISRVLPLELLKRGTFSCFIAEPRASFKGLLVKRGRIWAYLTADAYRLPLLVKATTPWGPMSAVLDEESIPLEIHRDSADFMNTS